MLLRLFLGLLLASSLSAEVLRVEIQARADVLGGREFGLAGAYEKLTGKVYFAADPNNAQDRIIADIGRAPRNPEGRVEYSADVFILQPKRPEKGNGAALFEVSNRGGKLMLRFFNRGAGSLDPTAAADFGDGFLLRQGYTLVWLGWQPDVPPQAGLLRLDAPVLTGVTGRVRADFEPTERTRRMPLADRNHIPYRPADLSEPAATLTVRDRVDAPRQAVARARWHFSTDGAFAELESGFEPNRIYELVYTGKDPVLVGLGPAAVRDFLSFLKYDAAKKTSRVNGVRRAYGFGVSQSGRFLRTFLYYGFNADEAGRPVFDGIIAHVAGGGRGSFNHRFAQPSRDAHPFMNFFYPTDIFPFTDAPQTDPETGERDGLLLRAEQQHAVPKIFYTNTSYEYWGRAASLIHTTVDGRQDMGIPPNVRIYWFAGGQHSPSPFPPSRTIGQQLSDPLDFTWTFRALLGDLDRWVKGEAQPPASVYPHVADASLVPLENVRFPKIPGVTFPTRLHLAYRVDYGPQWKEGIVSNEPPRVGKPFPVMVPQVDEDGNDTGGVRLPEFAVPLATYTGWNLFNEKSGPADEVSSMVGSFIPFAPSRAAREKRGDPRRSIAERYGDRDQYLGRISAATARLVHDGFLLPEDMPALVTQAASHWDYLAK